MARRSVIAKVLVGLVCASAATAPTVARAQIKSSRYYPEPRKEKKPSKEKEKPEEGDEKPPREAGQKDEKQEKGDEKPPREAGQKDEKQEKGDEKPPREGGARKAPENSGARAPESHRANEARPEEAAGEKVAETKRGEARMAPSRSTTATQPRSSSGSARPASPRRTDEPSEAKKDEKKDPLRVYEVRAFGTNKTSPETLRAIADVEKGTLITKEFLEQVRKRIINSKLFKKVEVFSEEMPGKPGWAYLYVEAKDRHSWFIAPMFTWEDGRYGGAIAYGECNLFGWGKRLGVAARYLTDSQGIGLGYDDPGVYNTKLHLRVGLGFERVLLNEFVRVMGDAMRAPLPARQIWVQQLFASLHFGYKFFRRLKVGFGYKFGLVAFADPKCIHKTDEGEDLATGCADPDEPFRGQYTSPIAFRQEDGSWRGSTYAGPKVWKWKREAVFQLKLRYSNMVDIYGVKDGWSVRLKLDISHPHLGSEFQFVKWSIRAAWAIKLFESHYVWLSARHEQAYDAPFHREAYMKGSSLPGYRHRFALGDTNTTTAVAYNLPLFNVWWLYFRQVFYYRTAWIFFRGAEGKAPYFEQSHGVRRYHLAHTPGPTDRASFLQSVGTGLRLYVKAVAIPLLGVDVAYGFESRDVRFYFYVGKAY